MDSSATVENAEGQTDSAEGTKADSTNESEKKKDKSPKKLKSFEIESEVKYLTMISTRQTLVREVISITPLS